jgi:Fe-S-cluster containining protein
MAGKSMPPTSADKEHQRVMRDLRQQGQAALTWGLPNPTTEAAVLGMGLLMRDKLEATGNAERASEAAALAAVMLDRTMQKMPQAAAVQCAKGCFYCCYSAVTVSAPEVFRLLREIPEADRADVLSRARARFKALSEGASVGLPACALLVDGACSVYESRPSACRQFVSTNADGCRAAHTSGNQELPFVPAGANAGLIVRSLLLGAMASLGREPATYELSSALAVVIEIPDAEKRWLEGEDVLAAAARMPQPPNMQNSVGRWSQMLRDLYV